MRRLTANAFWNWSWSCLLLAAFISPSTTNACTLWGAAGEDANGGTIISKNRDWKPDHIQVLEIRRSENNFAYLGLYAVGNDAEGIKQGVNEKGLTVVTATAGSIPKSTREAEPGKSGVMTTLLQRYATCDQILADKDKLFSGRKPQFLMISDRKKILVLEVGLKGRYAVKVVESGVTTHCNHFLDDSLSDCNLKTSESSATRVARISELLKAAPKPLDTAAFAAMSKDRHDGVNNSLWRTGSSGATLSSWIVETPRAGAPKLRVVIANPGQPERTNVFLLDEKFWKDTHLEHTTAAAKADLKINRPSASASDSASKRQGPIRVALYKGPGTGGNGPPNLLKQLNHAPEFTITNISPQQLQDGLLTNYDVVIFAGGSASKQASAIGPKGRAAVQRFVQNGGGYIGICAGAYLATSGSTNSRLNLLDATTISPKWQRGKGNVEMELTDEGKTIIRQPIGHFPVRYANGPIVKPAERADLPDFKTLASFRTELAMNGTPAGIMINAPAVFTGPFGRGRVAAVSPHPEQTEGLENVVPNLVSWAAQQGAGNHALSTADFRFDGPLGSEGARVDQVGTNSFRIILGHAPEHPDWANMCQFEITQHAKGVPLEIEAVFDSPNPLYLFDDYFYSWSHDGKNWTPIQWEKPRNGKTNRLIFPAFKENRVIVGHQVPLSADDIEGLLKKWGQHPHAKLHVIGESLNGRKIFRLEITDPDSPYPRSKRWIHYVKNQHPGEHNSQWRMAGMIDNLLSPEAADFRRRSICNFVLIMSPDSPSKGWYRVNAQGADMNRSFELAGASSNKVHEAQVCQKDIEAIMASETPITAFWAMHTWQNKLDVMTTSGSEIGTTLPAKEQFAELLKKNDAGRFINSIKFKELDLAGSWNQGVRKRLGITSTLCEGGGGILTQQENIASGEMFMKSLREFYTGLKQ